MATFETPLGTKEVESGNFRTFSVSDESSPQEPAAASPDQDKLARLKRLEAEVSEARKAKLEGKVSAEAKKRIEILCGIGRATKDITIGEHVFTLRTLSGAHQRELSLIGFDLAINQRGDMQYEIRSQIIARSLYAIDGQLFVDIVGSNDVDVMIGAIEKLDDVVLRLLMQHYSELSDENNRSFGIKTEEEVKEVVEDIKKA